MEKALRLTGIPSYLILVSENNILSIQAPDPARVGDEFLSYFSNKKVAAGPPPSPKR